MSPLGNGDDGVKISVSPRHEISGEELEDISPDEIPILVPKSFLAEAEACLAEREEASLLSDEDLEQEEQEDEFPADEDFEIEQDEEEDL